MRKTLAAVSPDTYQRALTLGAFTLHKTGVDVHGDPTWENLIGAWTFAKSAHRCAGFWLADILRYSATRPDWAERRAQLEDSTGLSAKRLANIRAVGAIDQSRRRDGVEFGIHAEVAGLPAEEQSKWLAKAEEGGWDRRTVRNAIKRARTAPVIDGRAETCHSVEVLVLVEVEAETPYAAEQAAWASVKGALAGISAARVIAAHSRPT